MSPLIEKLAGATVESFPYPHLVLEDVLPEDLCLSLLREMPSLETLSGGKPLQSNFRFSAPAKVVLEGDQYSEVWKKFISEFMTQEVMQAMLSVLAPSIREEFPEFESRFGVIEDLQMVPRKGQEQPLSSIGMDAQIAVNTPNLRQGTSVRRGHLDLPNKLFTGLLYLRDPEDDSEGAELEIQELLDPDIAFGPSFSVPDDQLRPIRTVPYRNNTLVIFLNTPRSIHAVTPRSATPFPRYHLNIVAEMSEPIFSVKSLPKTGLVESNRFGPLTRHISPAQIERAPFPHLVIENFLEEKLYRELEQTLPPIADSAAPTICFGTGSAHSDSDTEEGESIQDNTKMVRRLPSLLGDPDLPQIWREFLSAAVSQETMKDFFRIFSEDILREYPDFEERFTSIETFNAIPRDLPPSGPCDGEIGVIVGSQSPITQQACVQRQPHIKGPKKVIEGLILFRPDEDQSPGGEFDLFKVRDGFTPWFADGNQTDPAFLELAKRVPGRGNTLIMWVNTSRSIQQVTMRSLTEHSWPYVEFLIQMPEDLFELPRLNQRPFESISPYKQRESKQQEISVLSDGERVKMDALFVGSGWYPVEDRDGVPFRWTGPENSSQIRLKYLILEDSPSEVKKTKNYLLLKCDVLHAVTPKAVESTEISVNGEVIPIKPKLLEGHLMIEGRIPKELVIQSSGDLSVEIRVPESCRPCDLPSSMNPDIRKLGLGISSLSIELPLRGVKPAPDSSSEQGPQVIQ